MDPSLQITFFILVFWSFAIIFAFCELGAQVTERFKTLNEKLCQCKWYSHSHEVQKMLLIFMSTAQQLIFLRGFGGIVCTVCNAHEIRSKMYDNFSRQNDSFHIFMMIIFSSMLMSFLFRRYMLASHIL